MKDLIAALLLYLSQQPLDTEKIERLNTIDSKNNTVQITAKSYPTIEFSTKKQLVTIAYEGNVPAGFDYNSNTTLALYNHTKNVVYLHESVDLESVFGQSVLLHELVHFNQFKTGAYDVAECLQANEKLAYKVQNQYLIDNGLESLYSKRHIFFASLCPDFI